MVQPTSTAGPAANIVSEEQELQRLQALARYSVLDTLPEVAFDRIATLAARVFGTPIALISLVDEHRQWYKACRGLDTRETDRSLSFCTHALHGHDVMVVPDATLDPRFQGNPQVTGHPNIRFYAGAPLRTPDGYALGTLCVISDEPRAGLTEAERLTLLDLAAMVMDELELRLATIRLEEQALSSERMRRSLQESHRVTEALMGVQALLNLELGPEDTARHAVEVLANAASIDWSSLIAVQADEARVAATWQRAGLTLRSDPPRELKRDVGLLWRAVAQHRPVYVDDYAAAPDALPGMVEAGLRAAAWVPVGRFDGVLYVMSAARFREQAWSARDRALLEAGALSIERSLATHERERRRALEALTDPLTSLGNRRALDAALQDGANAGLVAVLDLDGFREVNDRYGRVRGDALLRLFASALQAGLPAGLAAYRVGGDVFVVLQTADAARDLRPEAVLDALDSAMVALSAAEQHAFGVAVGVALTPAEAADLQGALQLADARMTAHKRARARGAGPSVAPAAPQGAPLADEVRYDELSVSVAEGLLRVGAQVEALGAKEARVLATLALNPERLHSRAELVQAVWGQAEERSNALEVHISHLRRRLARLSRRLTIRSQRNAGYALHLLPHLPDDATPGA